MNSIVESHLEGMREKHKESDYNKIVSLGWIVEDPIRINDKKYYPATWGQEFQGQALLVVQLTRWYLFNWFGSTDCIGILLSKDGSREYVDTYWLMHEVGHP